MHTGEINIHTKVVQKKQAAEERANSTVSDLLYMRKGISARLLLLTEEGISESAKYSEVPMTAFIISS